MTSYSYLPYQQPGAVTSPDGLNAVRLNWEGTSTNGDIVVFSNYVNGGGPNPVSQAHLNAAVTALGDSLVDSGDISSYTSNVIEVV